MQDLSNIHEYATELTNDTGDTDPILEISPDSGLFLTIVNMVVRGSGEGIPVYADLRDSNDDQLPIGTSIRFQYEAPGDSDRTTVSDVRDNIQPWNNLSISQQQDEEFVDSVKIPLEGGPGQQINVRDIDSFYVTIESSAQIDWSNSQLYIEGNAVTESPM